MTTLILGATGGIGSALTQLWTPGELWLSGRDEGKLKTLAGERQAQMVKADLGYESQVSRLFGQLPGELETIIYAAGSAYPEPLAQLRAENVRHIWNANYFGVIWTLKYGLPKLAASGRLYVIGAREDLTTARGFSQYAASKAGLARLLSIARLEARGKTLTLVLPPAVDSRLWEQVGRVPKGAISPEVVAQAIVADRAGEGQDELRI